MQLQSHFFQLMKGVLMVLFALVSALAYSQVSVRYMPAKRALYHCGDTVRAELVMRLSPQSCLDGMKKTYIYFSGCEDVGNRQWKQLPNKIYMKELSIRIDNNAKNKARITITRNTDKESFFRQETFNIK